MDPRGPPRPRRKADGENAESADFWHRATVFTREGHGVTDIFTLTETAEEALWCDTRWLFVTVSPPGSLICILMDCRTQIDRYRSLICRSKESTAT